MTASELDRAYLEKQATANKRSISLFVSAGRTCLIGCLVIIPLALFSIIQYARYGWSLFLGWDTSTYAWWAAQVSANGPLSLILQGYPNMYILILAFCGAVVGNISTAEKILPFVIALPLGYSYYRISLETTGQRRLGYVGALLAGLSVNTLRLFSDLNRNLLSFGLIILVGTLMSARIGSANFSWRNNRKRALLLWLPLLTIAAYTQIETYVVVMIATFAQFASLRNATKAVWGILLVASPVIAILPLSWAFLTTYESGLSLLGLPSPTTSFVAENSFLYLGGLAIPFTIAGSIYAVRLARKGNQTANFLVMWLVSLLVLFPVSELLGLPLERLLYVVPVPALAITGIPLIATYGSKLGVGIAKRTHHPIHFPIPGRPMFSATIVILLVASTLLTSSAAADGFLRPYVSSPDIAQIMEAAQLARNMGYSLPILVMYGPKAADLSSIYRAYFGTQVPNNLAYYGKLQYLFTLPEPTNVYRFQYDPSYELDTSLKYRTEILQTLGNPNATLDHAIIIAGGAAYARPLSELFIAQFQVGPGIYIIPPEQLQLNQINSWRLDAYTDWTSITSVSDVNATWSTLPNTPVLYYVSNQRNANFEANYTVSLASSLPSLTLSLHYFDWGASYVFPDGSNSTLAPLNIYFDGRAVPIIQYSKPGASYYNTTIPTAVSAGLHQVTIQSGGQGQAVAVSLDYIQVCPNPCPYS